MKFTNTNVCTNGTHNAAMSYAMLPFSTHLSEPDDVGVQEGPVVDQFPFHILVNLRPHCRFQLHCVSGVLLEREVTSKQTTNYSMCPTY